MPAYLEESSSLKYFDKTYFQNIFLSLCSAAYLSALIKCFSYLFENSCRWLTFQLRMWLSSYVAMGWVMVISPWHCQNYSSHLDTTMNLSTSAHGALSSEVNHYGMCMWLYMRNTRSLVFSRSTRVIMPLQMPHSMTESKMVLIKPSQLYAKKSVRTAMTSKSEE
jgi:hypothetical protein